MSATTVEAVGVLCKRYGPGRLPGADNRTIGAGYAFATAALLASALFIVLHSASRLLAAGPAGLWLTGEGSLVYFSLLALPFVVPSAFAAGALAWLLVPQNRRYCGPLSGLVATVLTYLGATVLVAAAILGRMLLSQQTVVEPGIAVAVAALYGVFGFAFTFWVTLPIGALSGYIHEHAAVERQRHGDNSL